jgi:hypothetical protein
MKTAQPHELAAHDATRPASHMQLNCCSSYSGPWSWKVLIGSCGTDASECDATLGAVSTGSCGAVDPESAAAACGPCLKPPYCAYNFQCGYVVQMPKMIALVSDLMPADPWQEDCDEIHAN